jgi:hypothetical protein
MDGHHTHGDKGPGFAIPIGLASAGLMLMILPTLIHILILGLAFIGGISLGGGATYYLWRRKHPKQISQGMPRYIPPADERGAIAPQNHIHLHGMTTEQIREIMWGDNPWN